MTSIEDANWFVEGADHGSEAVLVKSSVVRTRETNAWLDADGAPIRTKEDERDWSTISMLGLGPVLTLDWDCHGRAWLDGWELPDRPSVEKRTLSSGSTAVVFSVTQVLELPDQDEDDEISLVRFHGYDKLTGKLVLNDFRIQGTWQGEPFSGTQLQEVEPTPIATDDVPDWLATLIRRLKDAPVANPPASVTLYGYRGHPVYFVPQRCCDIFSDLYNAEGEIIGHPDGGITGRGDGRVPDFFQERTNEELIWADERTIDPGLAQVAAPIESVEVLVLESFPPQYVVMVMSGLPNACFSFAGYHVNREGTTIRVDVLNWKPTDPELACAQIFRTVETRIPLGSDFESGQTYSVPVNGSKDSFVAQ